MKKKTIYSELAYIIGLAVLAFGTALIEKASFGLSMVVAPAYLIHLKVSEFLPLFSFGMSEYCFQGFLIILMCIILRKFRLNFLFSFITAVIYGFMLDGCMFIASFFSSEGMPLRICWFVSGIFLATLGIAFLFNTYLSPEAYELLVKKLSQTFGFPLFRTKFIYDVLSLILSVILSLVFFSSLTGIGIGTVISALVNGKLIVIWSKALTDAIEFKDLLKFRPFFDKD